MSGCDLRLSLWSRSPKNNYLSHSRPIRQLGPTAPYSIVHIPGSDPTREHQGAESYTCQYRPPPPFFPLPPIEHGRIGVSVATHSTSIQKTKVEPFQIPRDGSIPDHSSYCVLLSQYGLSTPLDPPARAHLSDRPHAHTTGTYLGPSPPILAHCGNTIFFLSFHLHRSPTNHDPLRPFFFFFPFCDGPFPRT